ncbi:lytic transglycosylase [Methyloceanibacter superfactus]|uniref:Lytic transglycosylase n=1 Tax=Methyloceanibacter superfactus TaxID=1774969 RepID=A0A1E3W263_9HYPH|nr:lytic murein transglycosylase [Methyloceanibacter superfactus]ODR99601.1 lytic transglycosylase [Methyloceanibacter superfactus]
MTARAGLCAAVLFGSASSALAACPGPAGFGKWLQGFKQQAIAEGISPQTVASALNGVTYFPTAIAHDRRQGVFAQDFLTFQGRMVSNNRLQVGKAMLRKYASVFNRIEQQYGVPGPVMVAYWGLETDFGKVMGNLPSIQSLATLSYDCRRPEEFREQLMYALKVIDRGDLQPGQMRGPAHGEVGQFQFQPKTYYNYAVDFDGDGHRDLVRSAPDSLASAANYLRSKGWQPGQPWLEEVRVSGNVPWDQADVTIRKPRAFWAQNGVTYRNGKPIPADNLQASLLLPMGRNGPAFLAYPNFTTVYLDWNNSLVYSTTAAYYATRLAGAPPLNRGNPEPFTAAETKQLQTLLARQGFDVGKIDGVIGAGTREAIRAMQIKYGLPADSIPVMSC